MTESGRSKVWDLLLVVLGSLVFAIISGVVINAISKGNNATGTDGSSQTPPTGAAKQNSDSSPLANSVIPSPGAPSGSGGQPSPTSIPKITGFLSDNEPVDADPKADTAYPNEGGYQANGTFYDHAIDMNAGCENGDGGDMWADWNLSRRWNSLTGVVALSDTSASGTRVSYRIYSDGAMAKSGSVGMGEADHISINVSGVYRIRLWLNDPTAPNTSCGDAVPHLVWANLTMQS